MFLEGTIKFAISINLALALFAAVIIARPKLVYVGATAIGLIAVIHIQVKHYLEIIQILLIGNYMD